MIILIRHASAGDRHAWAADDKARPLDARGRRQADELVELLEDYRLDRILSSPAVRCVQTVRPLAQARALSVEIADGLSEGQDAEGLIEGLRGAGANVVLSCHGGLSEAACGERQKKGEVLVLDDAGDVCSRMRARG